MCAYFIFSLLRCFFMCLLLVDRHSYSMKVAKLVGLQDGCGLSRRCDEAPQKYAEVIIVYLIGRVNRG